MVNSRTHSQNQRNSYFTQNLCMSNAFGGTHTLPSNQQHTQSQDYYHRHQTTTTHTHNPVNLYPLENSVTGAQFGAYDDAVTTKFWHDEWEVEPDDFGTPRPQLLLNRPAKIDLKNHAWRTRLVYLCHWDRGHEPDGVIAQRLAKAQRSRERGQAGAYMDSEQDMRRKRVKQAARNAEVIDLTGDESVGESKFRSYIGVENVGNRPPRTTVQLWRT